jgi:hypothetical protein
MSPSLLRALGRGSERDSRREAAIRRYGRPGRSPVNGSGGGADHRGRRSRRAPKVLVYVQRR